MNIKKVVLAVALSAASSAALAGGFDGPFAQIGIGFANAQSQLNFPGWLDVNVSDTSPVGEVAGGYSRSFGNFNLAASAYYTLGDQKAGNFTDAEYHTSVQVRLKNTWGISIEPGFNAGESTLVYASLGYGETRGSFVEYDSKGTFPWDQTLHGFSFGAGVKYKFTPNIYGVAELRQTNFQSKSIGFGGVYPEASFKPNSLNGVVGVGCKF